MGGLLRMRDIANFPETDKQEATKGLLNISRPFIYKLIAEGRFPKPVKINGSNASFWNEEEINEWANNNGLKLKEGHYHDIGVSSNKQEISPYDNHHKVRTLKQRIKQLNESIGKLERHILANEPSISLSGKALLTEEQIIEGSYSYSSFTGVYFLIKDKQVVYVGQAVNVHARISQHRDKCFDSYSYILCEKEMLDKLESIYIHVLKPRLNGNMSDGNKLAPLSFVDILECVPAIPVTTSDSLQDTADHFPDASALHKNTTSNRGR